MEENMNNDKLRAEFTNWLDTLAYRTKLNYIRNEARHSGQVSIDDISEEAFVSEDTFDVIEDERDFVFENEWLHNAYLELPKEKQRLLVLLFIEEKDAKEIAQILGCSQRYVYKQRAAIFDFIRERKERTNG